MLENVLKEYGFKDICLYGKEKAKLSVEDKKDKKGKLILMTSINPTPYGEGKTTMSIGLSDALCARGKKSIVVLREPSLGPVFGKKGGACGGGESIIEPVHDINLHFTGDMHAITSANNLISAVLDNHLYQGNALQIDIHSIVFNRCIDLNDRSLRNVEITINKELKRSEHFQITAASELMAIICLSKDYSDLYRRVGNIYVAKNIKGENIYVKDLNCVDAVCILLRDAFKPNAVLTKEKNLALVHGGPFANVAHGCSSYTSIELALQKADYVITEAGFGSDLGGFKFIDILTRLHMPLDLVVINVTIRALKYHGLGNLEKGISNLDFHIYNMKSLCSNVLVVLNQFEEDKEEEISYLQNYLSLKNIPHTFSTSFKEGSKGALLFADKVVSLLNQENKITYLYSLEEPLDIKIEKVLNHLGASHIEYTEESLKKLQEWKYIPYPICIAKTPMSITDDEKKLGYPKNYSLTVQDIKLCNGAEFILVYLGNILTLPGLGKDANLYKMQLKEYL
jgi:formate--tetrahydrofolate ligase